MPLGSTLVPLEASSLVCLMIDPPDSVVIGSWISGRCCYIVLDTPWNDRLVLTWNQVYIDLEISSNKYPNFLELHEETKISLSILRVYKITSANQAGSKLDPA